MGDGDGPRSPCCACRGCEEERGGRDDGQEERRSVVRQRFIGDLQTVVAAEGSRSCTCPWLAQVAS